MIPRNPLTKWMMSFEDFDLDLSLWIGGDLKVSKCLVWQTLCARGAC